MSCNHERDSRAESVQALVLICESYADVDAWQAWTANGDLVEAYPKELLDHITALTKRAEAAEARRNVWKDMLDSADCSAREGLGLLHCRLDAKCTVCSLRAECEALRKDAALLDYLADEPVFEGFSDSPLDVYELESIVAEQNGRSEPTQADRREAFRRMIDAALAVQPTTGEGA